MAPRIEKQGLQVATALVDFIETRALPGTGIPAEVFWAGLAAGVERFGPLNRAALAERESLQARIDAWHIARRGQDFDILAYQDFLHEIGYILPEGPEFQLQTTHVDPEIATIPGPQLVVPVMNARFALNAANARWGNLYDALYGTDALGDLPGEGFDTDRAARAIAWAKAFLDEAVPLEGALWRDVNGLAADETLVVFTQAGSCALRNPGQYIGHAEHGQLRKILLQNNGLKISIHINPADQLGANDPAHIAAVFLESALSAIMDCEDSVAAVDAEDKVVAYGNWLGLMRGDLSEDIRKGDKVITRRLADDHHYTARDGTPVQVKARALMLVRNVGHLMTTPAVLDAGGSEIGEGILDAYVTTLCALHDLQKTTEPRNSATGSVYVVKPKMHGPGEVALADAIFSHVEQVLGLPAYTVKLGIMDEERRTSANLRECIRAAQHRVAFINTGFLDRTGDEIHTSMEAGAMLPKGEMKSTAWIAAYEDRNVDIGLACGLQGRAQIGKGMWAMPDQMAAMLAIKGAHPMSGANCAWVPSPTAATLHATHYHRVNVLARQSQLKAEGPRATLTDLLTPPLATGNWNSDAVQSDVENNAQGILGYVVRWVDQGVGCSKVPDIHDIALMEDRATCRISSQALANWLHHGVITADQAMAALRKMAVVVDAQNAADPSYRPMAPECNGFAFRAACDLVLQGRSQPSGYTEPLLHRYRQLAKAAA